MAESGRRDPRTGASGPWPWTINAEGVGTFFETKDQAVAAVEALQARGVQSIDVGCMQVNLMYHPAAFASLGEAFDPQANASYAARFLTRLFAQTNAWAKATAAYHSQTPEHAAEYLRRVMALWPADQPFPGLAPAGPPSQYTAEFASRMAQEAADRARLYADMRPTAVPRRNGAAGPPLAVAARVAPGSERRAQLAMAGMPADLRPTGEGASARSRLAR